MFEDEKVVFGSDDRDTIEYRSVSKAAALAPLIGVASLIALFHPVAWIIPVLGIAVSLYALHVTSQPGSPYVGKSAAIAGLALCMFVGVFAVARWKIDRQIVSAQSREFAERFLEFVQEGDLARAIECMQSYSYRQPPTVPLAEFYSQDEDARKLLEDFKEREIVKAIRSAGKDARIEFVRIEDVSWPSYGMRCWARYQLTVPDETAIDFIVGTSRSVDRESGDSTPHWWVRDFDVVKDPASP